MTAEEGFLFSCSRRHFISISVWTEWRISRANSCRIFFV